MKHGYGQALKFLYIFFVAIIISACQSDIGLTEKKPTRVVVDSFIQASKIESLDVLVVVDTSGSMIDNYEDVGLGMETLRVDIENLTLDYQFGFITADPNRLSYVGPYDNMSTSIDILLAPSLLGSTGLEQGFAATYEFYNSEEGLSFIRPNADFLLFLISDEDEQSSISALLFKEWLDIEFSGVNHDVVCVANPDDEEGGWANEIGYKFIELSNLYGKDLIDIKDEDWSIWLSESSFITQQIDYIQLSEQDPIASSIVVYIDNEEIADWSYIEEKRIIQLDFIPEHGSLVEVGYQVYQ